MTDKGRKTLAYINQYYSNKEHFSAKDLSDITQDKVSGSTLNSLAKSGHLKKFNTSPVSYEFLTMDEDEAFSNLDGVYHDLNEIEEWPDFSSYRLGKEMIFAGQLIPDGENERLVWKPNEHFDNSYEGVLYAFVVNGKLYKIGKTDTSFAERVASYNCGKRAYRKNGTCSVTNYSILQTLLNFNIPVDVYCYLVPKATLRAFGTEIEIVTSPAKYIEGLFLKTAKDDFGNRLPGCIQD